MVKINETQRKRMLNGIEGVPINIHLNANDLEDGSTLDKILTKQQKNKIEKRKVEGKGLRLAISDKQLRDFKKVHNIEKVAPTEIK